MLFARTQIHRLFPCFNICICASSIFRANNKNSCMRNSAHTHTYKLYIKYIRYIKLNIYALPALQMAYLWVYICICVCELLATTVWALFSVFVICLMYVSALTVRRRWSRCRWHCSPCPPFALLCFVAQHFQCFMRFFVIFSFARLFSLNSHTHPHTSTSAKLLLLTLVLLSFTYFCHFPFVYSIQVLRLQYANPLPRSSLNARGRVKMWIKVFCKKKSYVTLQ